VDGPEPDGVVDAGEMVDQPTTFSVVNTYVILAGQAQVVKSVTTSWAATLSGWTIHEDRGRGVAWV
jgi:hypothetical protein